MIKINKSQAKIVNIMDEPQHNNGQRPNRQIPEEIVCCTISERKCCGWLCLTISIFIAGGIWMNRLIDREQILNLKPIEIKNKYETERFCRYNEGVDDFFCYGNYQVKIQQFSGPSRKMLCEEAIKLDQACTVSAINCKNDPSTLGSSGAVNCEVFNWWSCDMMVFCPGPTHILGKNKDYITNFVSELAQKANSDTQNQQKLLQSNQEKLRQSNKPWK